MIKLISEAIKRIKLLRIDPEFTRPRIWSNMELRRIAHNYYGGVLNVSGWADEDKEGGVYRDYFVNANSYKVSNLGGGEQIGVKKTLNDSLSMDLNIPIDKNLHQSFDLVLCYTVLEHVYNIFQAVSNLCNLTRDSIIVVVPFVQRLHYQSSSELGGYSDYWRFTPFLLKKIFSENNFEMVYCSGTDIPSSSLYYFFVFSRSPEKYLKLYGKPGDLELLPYGEDLYTIDKLKILLKYILFRQNNYYSYTYRDRSIPITKSDKQ